MTPEIESLAQQLIEAAEKATPEWKKVGLSVISDRGVIAKIPTPRMDGVFSCSDNAAYIALANPANITMLIRGFQEELKQPWKHSEHYRNPETGIVECDCCYQWALFAEATAINHAEELKQAEFACKVNGDENRQRIEYLEDELKQARRGALVEIAELYEAECENDCEDIQSCDVAANIRALMEKP